jgi:phosphoglycolate phosphatase
MTTETELVPSENPVDVMLCDVDGTLLHTMPAMHRSFVHALAPHGLTITDEQSLEVVGKGLVLEKCFKHLFGHFTDDACLELARVYREHYGTIITETTSVFPGVVSGLRRLQELKILVGLVSSRVTHMDATLIHCGIHDLVDRRAIITGDLVKGYDKPDPKGARMAMELLGVSPKRTAFVGDTPNDMQAALAAGIPWRFGITWGYGGAALLQSGATHIVHSFAEILLILFDKRPVLP